MKRLIIGLALVALLLVSVSCSQEEEVVPTVPTAPDEMYKAGVATSTPEALPQTEERMIVRTGDMSLVVADVTQGCDDIAHLAVRFDGYVVSSSISGEEEEMRGWISIRVPDERFDQALAEVRSLAVRVKSESTYSEDVTEEYIDLQARLKNAEATEQQYLVLLDKAVDVEDILSIYNYLSQVREQIEQIKGQMQYLERTSSMSYISVSLEPEVTVKPLVRVGWSALEVLKSAARGIVIFGQWLGTLAIWLVIFIPVWGTVLGIIIWRRRRSRTKKSPVKR